MVFGERKMSSQMAINAVVVDDDDTQMLKTGRGIKLALHLK